MNDGMIARNESFITPEMRSKYLEKLKTGTITPQDMEFIFTAMSEESQDRFLESLKGILSEADYNAFVTHLKAYDIMMLGKFRQKTKLMKEYLAVKMMD